MPATAPAPASSSPMAKSPATSADASRDVWDTATQQYHGGQDWQLLGSAFREDFSVTTNGLGTPKPALDAAKRAIDSIDHYPPANQEPALSSLAHFLWPESAADAAAADQQVAGNKSRLILGNGASELIDLVVRCSPAGAWRAGPTATQYKEYQRSAESHGRAVVRSDADAGKARADAQVKLVSLVNPTNPTGDYMPIAALRTWIETNVPDGATVTVDESMQPWVGPHWLADSLLSQSAWISEQWTARRVAVYVIHSWTKIWSCTGIRLGSVVCPTVEHAVELKRVQVPWSVNTPALAFLDEVVRDKAYMDKTWAVTTTWRKFAVDTITTFAKERGYAWAMHGESFLSWIWIDMKEAAVAEKAVDAAKRFGVPVRWAKYGYEMPTFVRIAVRAEAMTAELVKAWASVL